MNATLLKSFMVLNNDTQQKLADALKMNICTLNQRIMGKSEFKRNEMETIKKRYNLSNDDFSLIFFAD